MLLAVNSGRKQAKEDKLCGKRDAKLREKLVRISERLDTRSMTSSESRDVRPR